MRNCTRYEPYQGSDILLMLATAVIGSLIVALVGVAGLVVALLLIVAVYLLHDTVREMVSRLGGVGLFYGVACTAGMVAWVYYGMTYCG